MADLDALVLPTTPIVAPKIAEVATPETFGTQDALLLRNTALVNFFDLAPSRCRCRGMAGCRSG